RVDRGRSTRPATAGGGSTGSVDRESNRVSASVESVDRVSERVRASAGSVDRADVPGWGVCVVTVVGWRAGLGRSSWQSDDRASAAGASGVWVDLLDERGLTAWRRGGSDFV